MACVKSGYQQDAHQGKDQGKLSGKTSKVIYRPQLWVSKGKKGQKSANLSRRLVQTCLGLRAEFTFLEGV